MGVLTNRRVLAIALPIVLSNITVPLLGLVDTGVIGQLGQPAPIGAVGIGAVILASAYWIFGFLRMGTTGLVAQAHGAGDRTAAGAHLLRALAIAGGAGLLFILLQAPLFWAAFRLAPASAQVEALARDYLAIRIWGAPAAIAVFALTGWMIATERTRAVLALQLLMNGTNIALDLWFVLGLGWGVQGVAAASLMAEYLGAGFGLYLARDTIRAALGQPLWSAPELRRLSSVNGNILIRSVLLQASFTSFLFLAAGQGDVTLAANQVLLQFLTIAAYALDGFAFAAESLVGQAIGAGRPGQVRQASRLTAQWGVAGAVLMALVFALAGGTIIDALTTAPEVRAESRHYLPWLVVLPLVSVASYMFDGIFIGATLTREMRQTMTISAALYVMALVIFLPIWGNHGLWAALVVLNAARGLTMWPHYKKAEAAAAPA
ncbi:MAG: MATE family efflux transporter [Paracoccus sp. (in: a-proteobacteria)]|uniref:MATE family efflux transporter n=1 Tax=Paracoccus sp. TaxID=267 RepID=UPI0026E07C51|nr:MATE family efflux transporter [Paracoccus sp. (in: a-proteobacteria)]MDO5621078.1 MATE family efflux transporter [Paracoccus sp. (in: a-proteobacteria)]